MTAAQRIEPMPFYFGSPGCLGWWHAAPADDAKVPVLICGPVGAEDLSAHRMLRLAAEALAARGHACLRFDWPGVGDAEGLPDDADAVPAWLGAVGAAVDTLRSLTGAPQVAVLGLRLGATLAALAVQARDDIAAFAAWVPVSSGRAMLREWKMLGAAGLPSLIHPDGSLETGGIRYAAATCAALGQLKLTAQTVPARRMLVIDRDDLPTAAAWCEALRAGGVALEAESLPGYDGLMAVPHLVTLPDQMLARAVDWLAALPIDAPCVAARAGLVQTPLGLDLLVGGAPVREQPVQLAGSAHEPALWAILARPQAAVGALAGQAVLVLNTGAERRVGPHGQFVAPARRWAAAGATVLRLDLAGLGDSPAALGEDEHRVYPPAALQDVARALAWLRRQPGVQRVTVLGLCSGAFHAFEAAAARLDLDQAVVINPLVFFRPERVDFDAVPAQDHAVQQLSGETWRKLRDPASWRKLLAGGVNHRFILATLGRRLGLAGRRVGRTLLRAVGRPQADDLAAKLRRAAGAAATAAVPRLHFVFATGDPGRALLEAEAGRTFRSLIRQGQIVLHEVRDADHTFSRADARQRLQAELDGVLGLATPAARMPTLLASSAPAPDQAVTWASSTRRARCASASST